MKKSVATLVLASTILASCGGSALRYAGVEKKAEGEGLREAGLISFKCDPESAPSGMGAVGLATIGIGVDAAIGAISKSLANAQKARTGSWTATNSSDEISEECKKGTLKIERGAYRGGNPHLNPAFDLTAAVIIEESEDKSSLVLTIQPDTLIYSDTSARNRGKGRKDVTIGLSISSVGTQPTASSSTKSSDQANAAKDAEKKKVEPTEPTANLISLGRLEVGKEYTQIGSAMSMTVKKGVRHNISAIVTESEDPSVVLEAFAAAFESNKSDLAKALKDAIGGSDE